MIFMEGDKVVLNETFFKHRLRSEYLRGEVGVVLVKSGRLRTRVKFPSTSCKIWSTCYLTKVNNGLGKITEGMVL